MAMLEESYIFVLVILAAAAAIIILVRYGFRSKSDSDNKEHRSERRTSTLADRMEDVLRAQPDQDGRSSPPSYRRRSVAAAAAAAAAATGAAAAGGTSRLQPTSSFRLASRRREDTSTPPREDSPLLGQRPFEKEGEGEDEKVESQSWDLLAQGEHERRLGAALAGGDVESGRGGGASPPRGSETGSGGGSSRRTTGSAAPTTLSAADDALLRTFMEVMSEGLPIKIHRSSGRVRKTTMWLKDTDTLVWFSKRTVGGKRWHKLSLRGVTSVNAGKNSELMESRSAASADPALCLFLGFPSLILGLEASSELERDALVQGFSMLIEDLKAADDLQNFRDAEVGPTRNI